MEKTSTDERIPTFDLNDPKHPVVSVTVLFDVTSGRLKTHSNARDMELALKIMIEAAHALINMPPPPPQPIIERPNAPLPN